MTLNHFDCPGPNEKELGETDTETAAEGTEAANNKEERRTSRLHSAGIMFCPYE
jgi:hypothetical protein